jgi:hypothetical protein
MFKKLLLAASCLVAASAQAQVATISTTDLTVAGQNVSVGLQNATSPTYFTNDGNTVLVIKGGIVATTATIVTQAQQMTQQGLGTVTLGNQTVSIPSSSITIAGPFPVGRWNILASSTILVNFSSITTVSATALHLPL